MKKLLHLFILIPFLGLSQIQIGQDIDGEAAFDYSGTSVDISADGTILAVGAPGNDGNGDNSGHVRVYENIGGIWTQIGQDIDGEAADDKFGTSVSLSANGTVLAVGAPWNDENGTYSGHVRVYENINNIWTQIGLDIDGIYQYSALGTAVSLSADGTVLAVGQNGRNSETGISGLIRIYYNIQGSWIESPTIMYPHFDGYDGGKELDLSSDGNILVYGIPYSDAAIGNAAFGAAQIYHNIEGDWMKIGENITGYANNDRCGDGVAISADGNIIAIGSPGNDNALWDDIDFSSNSNYGRVRVFEIIGDNYFQLGSDIEGILLHDGIGFSLSLSSDGTILALAGKGDNYSYSNFVRIYKFISGDWVLLSSDIVGEADFDNSAESISMSDDGTILAIGAKNNDGNNTDSGHVRVYNISEAALSTKNFDLNSIILYPNPTKNQFTIQLDNPSELQNVSIYNKLGQLVLTSKEITINTSKLASGLYVVEIQTTEGKGSKKLIIE